MLDWTTSVWAINASQLNTGRIIRVGPDGDIDYEIEPWGDYPSFSTNIRLRKVSPVTRASRDILAWELKRGRHCPPECLAVSGNPTRWLHHHNVTGLAPTSHGALVRSLLTALTEADIGLPAFEVPELPGCSRSRMDVNLGFRMDDHKHLHEWLKLASLHSRSSRQKAMLQGDTVYWQKGSRRWSMKAYCKACEHSIHRPKDEIIARHVVKHDEIGSWFSSMDNAILRIELTLRGQELKQYGALTNEILYDYWNKLGMAIPSKSRNSNNQALYSLSSAYQASYFRWMEGQDLRCVLPKNTYYRHRRALYKALGVDINNPYEAPPEIENAATEYEEKWLRSRQLHNQDYLSGAGKDLFGKALHS